MQKDSTNDPRNKNTLNHEIDEQVHKERQENGKIGEEVERTKITKQANRSLNVAVAPTAAAMHQPYLAELPFDVATYLDHLAGAPLDSIAYDANLA